MKKLLFFAGTLLLQNALNAQPKQLTAAESDPANFGWMQGFPPAKDKILSGLDGSFFKFPAMRYSVCHMRQFFPTVNVPAAPGNRYTFRENLDAGIDAVTFQPTGEKDFMTWAKSLPINYTDGIMVLHKGTLVYEKYFGELSPEKLHAVMSVSKTFTGTLGAMLVAEGLLDEKKKASFYVPELGKSAFGDAIIRQILDMTTALDYSEDYADPNAGIWKYSAAGDPFRKPTDPTAPGNYFEALQTIKKKGIHGKAFGYKTVNTDALGWIISRVTGKAIPQLLSERIWQPLGTHHDAYYQVDGAGIAFAGGGLNANLRDAALFGEMIRNNGRFNGRQIVPASVVEDLKKGGNKNKFAKGDHSEMKGWSYKDMWWITGNKNGAFAARGVYGQTIYIDPKAEMVIVRFASHPVAANAANDPYSLPAYAAVAKYLMGK